MSTVKILAKRFREYKRSAIMTPILVLCEVLIETLIPLVMATLIDNMTGTTVMPILKYGGILVLLTLLSLMFGALTSHFAAKSVGGFAKNVRQDIYYKIQDFSFSDIDKFSTSSLVTRMTTDVTNVEEAANVSLKMAIRVPFMLICSFAFSAQINIKLASVFVVAIPILGACLILMIRTALPFFMKIFKKYDKMNESVQENVQSIRVVKSFVRENHEKEKFEKISGSVKEDFIHAEKIIALVYPLMFFCIYTVITIIVYVGSREIILSDATTLTTGELSALIGYAIQVLMSILMMSMVFVMLTISAESAKRIKEVLTAEPQLKNAENGIKVVDNGDIEFSNVAFKYSNDAENYALNNINIKIKSGETIGIIGGTGSSKTTLVQLIPRLYDVTDGSVMVSGHDVRDYDIGALRDSVSMVLQKNVLFAGSIKDNIRWGKEDASDQEIENVCKLSCADEFINEMPNRYDTYIEQGGTNVSGGQKQRLCIARALIKNPKILILDDSTSAVDTKTDAKIRKALKDSMPDTTKIIISQRISSVENADRIIVLDGGEVVAFDNHKNLMESCDIYREVYYSQMKTLKGGVYNG